MSKSPRVKQITGDSIGSILFIDSTGQGAENNSNLFWNNTNNRLGIGTITPSTRLQVKGTGTTSSTNSVRVENSSNVATLIIRDDGHITAGVGTSLTIGLLAKFDNTQVNNTSIGYNAGGGNRNTFIGAGAGAAVTTSAAGRNVAVGNGAAAALTTDFGHTAIGWSALQAQSGRTSTADGQMNVAVGYNTMQSNLTGIACTAIGSNTLQSNTAGNNNVAIGNTAGQLCTGSANLFLGYNAGRNQTTESNQLFIDNIGRTTKALELTNALIRGTFNANPALQYLRFNASLGIGVDATSRLHVQGLGSTSATNSLSIQNSSATNLLTVRDDGIMNVYGGNGLDSTFSVRGNRIGTGGSPWIIDMYNNNTSRSFIRANENGAGAATTAYVEIMGHVGTVACITAYDYNNTNPRVGFGSHTSGDAALINSRNDIASTGSDAFIQWSNSQSYMVIDSGKNLGYANPFLRMVTAGGATGDVKISSFGDSYFNGGFVGIGTITPNTKLDVDGDIAHRSTTPGSFSTDQNDFATTDTSFMRLNNTDISTHNITGFAGGFDGKCLVLANVGSSAIDLKHEDAGSSAANRMIIYIPGFGSTGDYTLNVDDTVEFIYDGTTSRWRKIN